MRGAARRCFVACLLVPAILGALAPASAAAVPAPAAPESAAWPAGAAPGRLVVSTDDALAAAALDAAPVAGTGAESVAPRVVAVEVPAGSESAHAAALEALPGVVAVEPDWLLTPHASPNDLRYLEQWSHQRTGTPAAWDTRTDATAARVAVIDTGVNANHPELAAAVTEQVDLSTGSLAGPASTDDIDNDPCAKGHGTQVAGVVAAAGDNTADVAGVAWTADVLDISVASSRPGADCVNIPMSSIVAGITYAVQGTQRPASVISISMGGFTGGCPTSMQSAINQAWTAGTIVVASAGNGEKSSETQGQKSYPASCDKVISVSATGPNDVRAPYSQRNDAVDIAAPGGDSTMPGGTILTTGRDLAISTVRVQGTSFAAPYVSGALALARAARPDLPPATVAGLLTSTATDLGDAGRDSSYGAGLVNVSALLAATLAAPAPVQGDTGGGGTDDGGTGGGTSGGTGGGALPAPAPSPTPSPAPDPEPVPAPEVERVSSGAGTTEPVAQAVAVSRAAFDRGGAQHAVLARADDFADALAGSALGMGEGPLLFAPREGGLPEATRAELARALPQGATVYLLGGAGALAPALEDELRALGFSPVRLSGPSREETAATVAREVARRAAELGHAWPGRVVLATRDNWPDAVSGGGMAALLAAPVLLTPTDSLHPATAAALAELKPARVVVVGGTGVLSQPVADEAGQAAGGARVQRLSGPTRDATAVAVAREARRLLVVRDQAPRYAIAVNLRRGDGFAHALSASVLAGAQGAVLVPVERDNGSELTEAARDWVATELDDPATDVVLAGEPDILSEVVGDELRELMRQARSAAR